MPEVQVQRVWFLLSFWILLLEFEVKRAVFSEGEISVSGNLVSGAKITMNFLFPMLHGLDASIDYERVSKSLA